MPDLSGKGDFTETGLFTSEGRPILKDPSGRMASEISITVMHPDINSGKATNIPTIFGGVALRGTFEEIERQAIAKIIEAGGKDPDTGRILPSFDTIELAIQAARNRSRGLRPDQTPLESIFGETP